MNRNDDPQRDPKAEQRLAQAAPPLALDSVRVQQTLRQAAHHLQHRRRIELWARTAAAAVLIVLAGAGFWRWSGEDSHLQLTFGRAIEVTESTDSYSKENVRMASGRLWMDSKNILRDLTNQGAVTPAMRTALLAALDATHPPDATYRGGFEALRRKVTNLVPLSPDELSALTHTLCAGVRALRQLAERNPEFTLEMRIMCDRLRHQVDDAVAPLPATTPARRN